MEVIGYTKVNKIKILTRKCDMVTEEQLIVKLQLQFRLKISCIKLTKQNSERYFIITEI